MQPGRKHSPKNQENWVLASHFLCVALGNSLELSEAGSSGKWRFECLVQNNGRTQLRPESKQVGLPIYAEANCLTSLTP